MMHAMPQFRYDATRFPVNAGLAVSPTASNTYASKTGDPTQRRVNDLARASENRQDPPTAL